MSGRWLPPLCCSLSVVSAAMAAFGAAPTPSCAVGACAASRFRLIAAQPSRSWTWKAGVPRQRDAVEPVQVLQLGDRALRVGHPSPVRPDAGVAFRARLRREREPLRVRARLATVAGQHRLLRGDVRDDPALRGVLPDTLGSEALVGPDAGQLRQDEADTVEDRSQRVAFVALGPLAEAAGDTTLLRINADVAAVDEVRALAGLSHQPRVRVAGRDGGRVRGFAFRRRPRARLRQAQL